MCSTAQSMASVCVCVSKLGASAHWQSTTHAKSDDSFAVCIEYTCVDAVYCLVVWRILGNAFTCEMYGRGKFAHRKSFILHLLSGKNFAYFMCCARIPDRRHVITPPSHHQPKTLKPTAAETSKTAPECRRKIAELAQRTPINNFPLRRAHIKHCG